MATKKSERSQKANKRRASWKGQLSFGLVSFTVEAFNALDREHGDIHFHQLHSRCHSRIHYEKVCPIHGEVPNDQIVSGYEYKKGEYVEIDAEELEALRTASDRALKIDAFVNPSAIDPLYFDGRMFYLLPADDASREPFTVMVEALEREGRYGVGQVVMSGKDQIALVRPLEGLLHMAMLNYEAEIRPAQSMAAALKKPNAIARQVRLAQQLVEEWSRENFDFSVYHDTYREKVAEIIEAKVHGRDIVVPKEEEEPEKAVDLMDALRKSIAIRSRTNARGKARRRSA